MPKTSKMKRIELYKDRRTQVFLNKFLADGMAELKPVYDSSLSLVSSLGYRYPIVEAIIGDISNVEDFLNRLYEAGILDRRLYDKTILCPKCGSAGISVHYCCPYCRSFDVVKSSLIEHVKCGYMDVEGNFLKENGLVCPKCDEELKSPDVDHRRAGIWCTCKHCHKSFDIPVTSHFCRNCHEDSTFEDAVVKEVYIYNLKEGVEEEAALGWAVFAPLAEFLEENEYEVETPAFLKGKSGANHKFDMVTYRGVAKKRVTVIDLASSKENAVSEQPVIALFAKIFDVSPDNAYLIAIPFMSENGKKMAKLYNIKVIESKEQKEALKILKDELLEKQ